MKTTIVIRDITKKNPLIRALDVVLDTYLQDNKSFVVIQIIAG